MSGRTSLPARHVPQHAPDQPQPWPIYGQPTHCWTTRFHDASREMRFSSVWVILLSGRIQNESGMKGGEKSRWRKADEKKMGLIVDINDLGDVNIFV